MNRLTKAILSIAIAIVYLALVWAMSIFIYPEETNKTAPNRPNFNECISNSKLSAPETQRLCRDRLENEYELQQKAYEGDKDGSYEELINKRLEIIVFAALLGFIIALAMYKFSPISIGMAGGSATLIIGASWSLAFSLKDSSPLLIIGFSLCFIFLVATIYLADKLMVASNKIESKKKKK